MNWQKHPDVEKICSNFWLNFQLLEPLFIIWHSRNQIIDAFVNNYYYKGHLVPQKLIHTYYQSAHIGDGGGKYLLASIKSYYTILILYLLLRKSITAFAWLVEKNILILRMSSMIIKSLIRQLKMHIFQILRVFHSWKHQQIVKLVNIFSTCVIERRMRFPRFKCVKH